MAGNRLFELQKLSTVGLEGTLAALFWIPTWGLWGLRSGAGWRAEDNERELEVEWGWCWFSEEEGLSVPPL